MLHGAVTGQAAGSLPDKVHAGNSRPCQVPVEWVIRAIVKALLKTYLGTCETYFGLTPNDNRWRVIIDKALTTWVLIERYGCTETADPSMARVLGFMLKLPQTLEQWDHNGISGQLDSASDTFEILLTPLVSLMMKMPSTQGRELAKIVQLQQR